MNNKRNSLLISRVSTLYKVRQMLWCWWSFYLLVHLEIVEIVIVRLFHEIHMCMSFNFHSTWNSDSSIVCPNLRHDAVSFQCEVFDVICAMPYQPTGFAIRLRVANEMAAGSFSHFLSNQTFWADFVLAIQSNDFQFQLFHENSISSFQCKGMEMKRFTDLNFT